MSQLEASDTVNVATNATRPARATGDILSAAGDLAVGRLVATGDTREDSRRGGGLHAAGRCQMVVERGQTKRELAKPSGLIVVGATKHCPRLRLRLKRVIMAVNVAGAPRANTTADGYGAARGCKASLSLCQTYLQPDDQHSVQQFETAPNRYGAIFLRAEIGPRCARRAKRKRLE